VNEGENHHRGRNEVIIVKRHGGSDQDGSHGGAWKIAYADFMTAMMAFFLVMWLVNAANEQTKASIASYFNPIKLADEKPTEKGIKTPVDEAHGEETKEMSKEKADEQVKGAAAAAGSDQTSTAGDQAIYSEADFFENPYSVLAEIAQEVGLQANVSAKGEGGVSDSGPATGADGGKAHRDPFDPDFWTKQVRVSTARKDAAGLAEKSVDTPNGEVVTMAMATASDNGKLESKPLIPEDQLGEDEQQSRDTPAPEPPARPGGRVILKMTAEQKSEAEERTGHEVASTASQSSKPEQQAARDLQEEIVHDIGGVAGKLAEGLAVTPSEGGLLVTISDRGNDPMFNVGSAVPRREMVLAMERIGRILANHKGAVIIRGHTDGRQFKDLQNDNWRLSLDRAQSAYYMLVRGGLDEKRISQVSGFADRRLKVPDDPFNDANRRIEILVQGNQG
jgi:chemotaxis protein MotB